MKYLIYDPSVSFTLIEARQVAAGVLAHYYPAYRKSVSQWIKDDEKLKKSRTSLTWQWNAINQKSKPFLFRDIAQSIFKLKDWDHQQFNFPAIQPSFFDSSMSLGGGTAGLGLSITMGQYGNNFPIKPKIDREGAITSTFQNYITANILKLHNRIVDHSNELNAAGMPDTDWFNDLRLLINECISLVEIHLHTLYTMAKFNGQTYGFHFNQTDFGLQYGRRIKDKFSWLYHATQKDFNCPQNLMLDFDTLREIRNHLNHFDPPCFAYDIIDIQNWLNCVPSMGRLIRHIREHLNQPINRDIIRIMALPNVQSKGMKKTIDKTCGYNSSKW